MNGHQLRVLLRALMRWRLLSAIAFGSCSCSEFFIDLVMVRLLGQMRVRLVVYLGNGLSELKRSVRWSVGVFSCIIPTVMTF